MTTLTIVQNSRRELALVHGRRGPGLRHHPNTLPRAYLAYLGAGQDAVTDFTVTQDSRCGLALVHGRRGPDLQHHPNTLPRAYLGA